MLTLFHFRRRLCKFIENLIKCRGIFAYPFTLSDLSCGFGRHNGVDLLLVGVLNDIPHCDNLLRISFGGHDVLLLRCPKFVVVPIFNFLKKVSEINWQKVQ